MIIPLYQAEIAHPSIRGRITSLQQFMLGIGALVAGWISYGTYIGIKESSAQWRLPLGLQMLPAVILAGLIFLFPESPRWLIDHGYPDKGLATLARLHANGDESDPWVRAEFNQIQDSITFEHEHEAKSYMELFTNKSSLRRLTLACALQASVQMTGVSAIQYYSVKIYGQIGITGSDALKYQAINNIIALLGETCCVLFIDKLGRRWPLIMGNLFNMVCYPSTSLYLPQSTLQPFTPNLLTPPPTARLPHRLHPHRAISPRHKPQPRRLLGFHNNDLALQLLLFLFLRPTLLGHPRRDLRHPYAIQGSLHRHHGILRFQHRYWTSNRFGHDQYRIPLLLSVYYL